MVIDVLPALTSVYPIGFCVVAFPFASINAVAFCDWDMGRDMIYRFSVQFYYPHRADGQKPTFIRTVTSPGSVSRALFSSLYLTDPAKGLQLIHFFNSTKSLNKNEPSVAMVSMQKGTSVFSLLLDPCSQLHFF